MTDVLAYTLALAIHAVLVIVMIATEILPLLPRLRHKGIDDDEWVFLDTLEELAQNVPDRLEKVRC